MTKGGKSYSTPRNIWLRDGILGFGAQLAAAPTDTAVVALYTRGTTPSLYFWNGTTETQIGEAGSGGLSTWDELYDSDKTLTVDSSTLTINLTHATGDGLTLSASAAAATSTASVLQFANGGSGKDVQGTNDTWYFTNGGDQSLNGILYVTNIDASSTGNVNLTIDAAGTGTIGIGATSTGAVTITPALTATASLTITGSGEATVLGITTGNLVMSDGIVSITAANKSDTTTLYAYDTESSTGVIAHIKARALTTGSLLKLETDEGYLSGGYYLICYDSTATANVFSIAENGAVTIAGASASNVVDLTLGDILVEDGSLTLLDTDDSPILEIMNTTLTASKLINIDLLGTVTGIVLEMDASAITTGTFIRAIGGAMTTGYFLDFDDGGTSCFTVGHDGVTAITSTSDDDTISLTVAGAQHGNYDLVKFDHSNASRAIASGYAVLRIDDGGAMASGASALLIDITGTPSATAYGIKVSAAGSFGLQALNIDSDTDTSSVALINGGGALATTKAVLEVTCDGTPAAATTNVLRVGFSGTDTNAPRIVEIAGGGKNAVGLYVDADPTTLSLVTLHTDAVIASGKSVLDIEQATGAIVGNLLKTTSTATPAAGCILNYFTFGGTATNTPVIVQSSSSLNAQTLKVIGHVAAATYPVSQIFQLSATGATPVLALDQTDDDYEFIKFTGTWGTTAHSVIQSTVDYTTSPLVYVLVSINGSPAYLPAYQA